MLDYPDCSFACEMHELEYFQIFSDFRNSASILGYVHQLRLLPVELRGRPFGPVGHSLALNLVMVVSIFPQHLVVTCCNYY